MSVKEMVDNKLGLEMMPLDDALAKLTKRNYKLHATEEMARSIRKYGFLDPPNYEPSLNGGDGGFKHGNGRIRAVETIREDGHPAPAGIEVTKGVWHLPVIVGNSIPNEAAAEAYGIDHNNLTLAGGEFSTVDIAVLYDKDEYADHLVEIHKAGGETVTVAELDVMSLVASASSDLPFFNDTPPEELSPEEGETDSDRKPHNIIFKMGPFFFKVATDSFIQWESAVHHKVGFRENLVIQEILGRLRL